MTPFVVRRRSLLSLAYAGLTLMLACGCGSGLTLGGAGDATARTAQGGAFSGGFGNPLELSDDQKSLASDIFQQMRDDVHALREQARIDIRNVLTPAQQMQWDDIRANHAVPNEVAGPGGFGMGPMGSRPASMTGEPGAMGMGPPPMLMGRLNAQAMMLKHMTEALGLSDEQKAQIGAIQDALRQAVMARRAQAIEELREILTAEQIAILDELELQKPE